MQTIFDKLLYTMNHISVCGKENIARMNACIETIERLKVLLAEKPEAKQPEADAPE